MTKLCMVTYLRTTENFTHELELLAVSLDEMVDSFKCVVFTDGQLVKLSNYSLNISVISMPGTKYRRLLHVLKEEESEFIISVDNDVAANMHEIRKFVADMINNYSDVGWGKIAAYGNKDFFSMLVAIDKLRSHNIIRPLLWKIGQGISIPGQCFMIKTDSFRGKLPEIDTYLDDLALGLYVNSKQKELHIHYEPKMLATERANDSFGGLWRQRQRWAIGYSSILKSTRGFRDTFLVLTHGFFYHFLWIPHWLSVFLLASKFGLLYALVYIFLVATTVSGNKPVFFYYSLIYQVVFPLFHVRWISVLLRSLVKR